MNNKGQFSIIAALLVAVVLVASVVTTYSAVRYSQFRDQPQILSAVDETNLGLKQILGFTVGYYGSVLKVTGNMTYAQKLAQNYFQSGLTKIGEIRPEWGLSMSLTNLDLTTNWFSDTSFSQGFVNVNYNLTGLGISGVGYSTSIRLDVQIENDALANQAEFTVLTDGNEPLINLGKTNFKFFKYDNQTSAWNLTLPTNVVSYADGTYVIDLPPGVLDKAYVIQVEDTRGLMVLASSFTQFTTSLTWNSTSYGTDFDFVDYANLDVLGSHSNFVAQQSGPDTSYDTLTEIQDGFVAQPCYPSSYKLYGSTTYASGSPNDLQTNNGGYLSFHAYASSFSGLSSFGYTTIGTSTQSIEDTIRGSLFSIPESGQLQQISAYLDLTGGALNRGVKTAIYSVNHDYIAETEELIVPSTGWYNFSFADPKPIIQANSNYILVAWTNSGTGDVLLHYDSGSANQGHRRNQNYGAWPSSANFNHDSNKYSIYCKYSPANQHIAQVELVGNSSVPFPWNRLGWTTDSSASTSGVTATFQLYNSATSQYPVSGDGKMVATLGPGDSTQTQTIITNPTNYVNSSGYWKVNVTAIKATSTPFDLNLDFVEYNPDGPNYAINLQEQWLNVNGSNLRQDLCIKTGTMSTEPLIVQILYNGSWQNLMTLAPNNFNNASLVPYIDSTTITIRFIGSNEVTDPIQSSWNIDAVFLKDQPDISFLLSQQQSSTLTIEVLQNGTIRWLGQNLQITTPTFPIPPIPVRGIHVNQTINGVNQEVPFQIEDWASNYQIPLGLTSNTTLFSNRQMVVFLIDSKVTDFTIWWNGSDAATQTPLAFTNQYFTNDNPGVSRLSNGQVTLQFGSFNVQATVGSTSSTANFMRINQQNSVYGAGAAFIIHHGIVRDIVQQESEWNNGPAGSPNLYANIVITLPAKATYYTYQLRIMFISSSQARSITDLSPIRLTTSLGSPTLQTENATRAGFPILQNGSATYPNFVSGGWAPHHFTQFVTDTGKGAGIMFTDIDNQKLYAFNSFPSSTSNGALKTSNGLLDLLPVSQSQVQFTSAYDITWNGAVVTFDNTTPLCGLYSATTPFGFWILAEYPPTLTVIPKS